MLREKKQKACGLCGATTNLTKTPCCDNWVCDDADKYVPFHMLGIVVIGIMIDILYVQLIIMQIIKMIGKAVKNVKMSMV